MQSMFNYNVAVSAHYRVVGEGKSLIKVTVPDFGD